LHFSESSFEIGLLAVNATFNVAIYPTFICQSPFCCLVYLSVYSAGRFSKHGRHRFNHGLRWQMHESLAHWPTSPSTVSKLDSLTMAHEPLGGAQRFTALPRNLLSYSMRGFEQLVTRNDLRHKTPAQSLFCRYRFTGKQQFSLARAPPIIRGSNQAPPSPGISPIFKKVAPKIALSEAMRISHKHATSLPRPMAGPLTAAMAGTSSPHRLLTI
jgi:hypothetical protein